MPEQKREPWWHVFFRCPVKPIYGDVVIELVIVVEETARFVWYELHPPDSDGEVVRTEKSGYLAGVFHTWEEAHVYAVDEQQKHVVEVEGYLKQATELLNEIKGMKKPEVLNA